MWGMWLTGGVLWFFSGVFYRTQQRGKVIPHQKFVLPDAWGGSPSVQNPGEHSKWASSEFDCRSFHTAAGCSICSVNQSISFAQQPLMRRFNYDLLQMFYRRKSGRRRSKSTRSGFCCVFLSLRVTRRRWTSSGWAGLSPSWTCRGTDTERPEIL